MILRPTPALLRAILCVLPLASACAKQHFEPGDANLGPIQGDVLEESSEDDAGMMPPDVGLPEEDVPPPPPPPPPEDVPSTPEDRGTPEVDSGVFVLDVPVGPVDTGPRCPTGLADCFGSCVELATDSMNCGACGRACTGGRGCASGACACPVGQMFCGSVCRDVSADPANCGACGRACASGESCVAGACRSVCPAGQTSCAGVCRSLQTDVANCGACGRACGAGQMCSLGACRAVTLGGPVFQVNWLGPTRCAVADHTVATGDDRGGIALSSARLFYTGDTDTGRFDLDTLAGLSVGRQSDALVSNLRTATVYTFANGSAPLSGTGGVATALVELDGATGGLTSRSIALSSPIPMGATGTGIFSGYDRVVVLTNGRAYHVELPTGAVVDLGPMASPPHVSCESWAYWGTAEFFGATLYVDYVQDFRTIVRRSVPAGVQTTVSTFSNLSDMCSFTIAPLARRWYFHYEGTAQFGAGSGENVGYCEASTSVAGGVCPTGHAQCAGVCRDVTSDPVNCGACGRVCTTGQTCQAGACTVVCPTGQTACSGVCRNLTTDNANCGACARVCATGQTCQAGVCTAPPAGRYTYGTPPATVLFTSVCGTAGARRDLASVDDSAVLVPLPFAFTFWGQPLAAGSMVNLASNGFLSLGATTTAANLSGTIPSTLTPNNVIAAHWKDLVTGTDGVCSATLGAAPNRRWVVQWSNVRNYGGGGTLNFEIVLNEGTNTVDLLYSTMTGALTATVGMENAAGTMSVGGCPAGGTSCVVTAGTRVRFTPSP